MNQADWERCHSWRHVVITSVEKELAGKDAGAPRSFHGQTSANLELLETVLRISLGGMSSWH